MKQKLKLFVWEGDGVLTDYTNGMICVLAHDLEEAFDLIDDKYDLAKKNFLAAQVKVVENPEAFVCWGGG